MTTFRFATPWLLLLLPVLFLGAFAFQRWLRRPVALRVPSLLFFDDAPEGWRLRLARIVPPTLRILALTLGLLALARPQSVERKQWIESTGVDIVLVIDTSGSMKIIDMDPRKGRVSDLHRRFTFRGFFDVGTAAPDTMDRLDVVKSVASDFIKKRKGDQLSLVIFGSEARTFTPLTHDRHAVATMLQQTEIGMAGEATDLQKGIEYGLKRLLGLTVEDILEQAKTRSKDFLLEQIKTRRCSFLFDSDTEKRLAAASLPKEVIDAMRSKKPRSQLMILLTDGKHTAKEGSEGREDVIKAARDAALYNVKIYTIGIGSKQAYTFLRTKRDGRENVVRIPNDSYDEDLMQEIAKITRARFFSAQDRAALQTVYTEIDRLEPNQTQIRSWEKTSEHYLWFLLPALALLALEILLKETLLRRLP